MITARSAALALLCGPVVSLAAQDEGIGSLRPNVVRVEGVAAAGFGFIVGLEHRGLLIATAWHTVRQDADSTPTICFLPEMAGCVRGEVIYVDDPVDATSRGLDLAVIRVAYPEGLRWRPDVEGALPRPDAAVSFIGRGGDWYIPSVTGRAADLDITTGLLRYRGLPVAAGVSGAPVIADDGIVAMHVSSDGEFGRGVPIADIAHRLRERMRARWALVPPDRCMDRGRGTSEFLGITVKVYFPWNRLDRALPAIARLHCLGVAPRAVPVWELGELEAEGVRYPSGGLRMARMLQGALADIAPLDARRGSGAGVEVWIR